MQMTIVTTYGASQLSLTQIDLQAKESVWFKESESFLAGFEFPKPCLIRDGDDFLEASCLFLC